MLREEHHKEELINAGKFDVLDYEPPAKVTDDKALKREINTLES